MFAKRIAVSVFWCLFNFYFEFKNESLFCSIVIPSLIPQSFWANAGPWAKGFAQTPPPLTSHSFCSPNRGRKNVFRFGAEMVSSAIDVIGAFFVVVQKKYPFSAEHWKQSSDLENSGGNPIKHFSTNFYDGVVTTIWIKLLHSVV